MIFNGRDGLYAEMSSYIARWIPVVLWMILIFSLSTDLGSSAQSSRIIGPIFRFFNPDVSQETINQAQLIVRKTGHLAEYAILAILCWRAFAFQPGGRQSRDRRNFAKAFCLASLYAVTDEYHQSFVATRLASGYDVLIDIGGVCIGLGLILLWERWNGSN